MPEALRGLLDSHPLVNEVVELVTLVAVATLAYYVVRRVLVVAIRSAAKRSATHWDDAFVEARVFVRLAQIAPALVVYFGVAFFANLSESLATFIERAAASVLVVVGAVAMTSALSAVDVIYMTNPANRERPIKGYLQVGSIAIYLAAALLVLATWMGRSPLIFLSGLGAMTAILLLVFRDTILSLVASVQLTGNDMLHVGDWIEMPQYGADGDVIDVALHTVTVQNWDKTITSIPTHALISNSFKNWRGMSQSGGRRIKRALMLDMNSVTFLDEKQREKGSQLALMADYFDTKQHEIVTYNEERVREASARSPEGRPAIRAELRRLTNIGTFRAYIERYLRAHPQIRNDMTLMVRQLQPTAEGLPIEIYCFTATTDWGTYESIQADLFDHLLAIAPHFGLRVFQSPSGGDFQTLGRSRGAA